MASLASAISIASIEERIAPLRARLAAHPLYASIQTIQHIRTFMEWHVYAVWDFMSLLKALQQRLTCVATPWTPTALPESRRFINEIVLGEESDVFEGRSISHYELYLEAMEEAGADTRAMRDLLTRPEALSLVPKGPREFVKTTFAFVESGDLAALAAAFTFGREDVIPDMFRELVRDVHRSGSGNLRKFVWYLERHIAVDGDEHGPLSRRMIADLCGSDEKQWAVAALAAERAMTARLTLWDAILDALNKA